jgi:hypothetical protein
MFKFKFKCIGLIFAQLIVLLVIAQVSPPTNLSAQNTFPSMTQFAGVPSGTCTNGTLALDQADGALYVCNGGVWVPVGGGIGGTVGSPFLPYASGPDALSDSELQYLVGSACFGGLPYFPTEACISTSDNEDGANIISTYGGRGPVSINSDTNEWTFFGPNDIEAGENWPSPQTPYCQYGSRGVMCQDPSNNTSFSWDSTVAELIVGFNGAEGGSLILNDATSGSSTLSVSGSTLVITGGSAEIPAIESTTGQRFVCVGTDGSLTSSAAPCVGT